MKLLFDTHVLLWALTDDDRLPKKARTLIEDTSNEVFFSLASIWETEIKHSLGKMPISGQHLYNRCMDAGYLPVKIEAEHIALLSTLRRSDTAPKHSDPFDRIMIVQSRFEDMQFVTHDGLLDDYNESHVIKV